MRMDDDGVLTGLPESDAPTSRRFEGLYGRIYDTVIKSTAMRRLLFSLWGSSEPLQDLKGFVAEAASGASTLVDVPSGGGTLLRFLAQLRYSGTVVEVDLASAMMRGAVDVARRLGATELNVVFIRADALDLPLSDEVADAVVSINGLHVVEDHAQFLAELARITKPAGALWLITPVDGPSLRSRAILAAARALDITPGRPPTLARLRELLEGVGYVDIAWRGGESIAGFSCRKP
jgi:SAM-dependent methyltransferase